MEDSLVIKELGLTLASVRDRGTELGPESRSSSGYVHRIVASEENQY